MIERSGVCFSPLSRWFAAFLPTPRSFMAQILNFAFSNQCYKKYITYTSLYINKYIYIYYLLVKSCWLLLVPWISMLLNYEVVGQCASGNSCQLSPPGTSMTCASSAYYPATDAVGLVTAAEKEVGRAWGWTISATFFRSFHRKMRVSPENRIGGRMSPPSGIVGLGGRWRCRTPLRSSQNPLVL